MSATRRLSLPIALLCAAPILLLAAYQGPPMKPQQPLPDDRDKTAVVDIAASPHAYELRMDATVDGVMTRMPIGYAAYEQGWQPNRFVRMKNVGETDLINPRLVVNGKRKWQTLEEIAREAVGDYTADRDKARAVWEFTRHHRFHATTWCAECNDAVKVFNVYGYTLCGNDAIIISDVWQAAGLTTRSGHPVGHCVTEVLYDGEFHLLDGDEHCIYLKRDNRTIASEADIVRDHDLIKRTHTYGILTADSQTRDQFSASLFGYEGERKGTRKRQTKHTLEFVLRPGESVEWRWDHIGKQYTAGTEPPKDGSRSDGQGDLFCWGSTAYAKLRNGKLRYAPDLSHALSRQGFADSANIAPAQAGTGLHPQSAGTPSHVVWRVTSPYVIVGAKVALNAQRSGTDDRLSLSLSPDGKKWERLWAAGEQQGEFDEQIGFDDKLSLRRKPQYTYFLKLEMTGTNQPGDVAVKSVSIETDVQMSALALPELEAGLNQVVYEDGSTGQRQVRVTHSWIERPAWHPPSAPELVSPSEGAVVEGTQVTFAWKSAQDPDGDAMADYHVQVSAHPDMRWVLSPNFDKLISRTPSNGKTEWAVPYVGLLNPGEDYYWRVRAKDANGAWGGWSDVRSFRCDAPGVPLSVSAEADAEQGTVVLKWKPNPQGAKPAEYRIYASDEKGFSISDTVHKVKMGRGFCNDVEDFEARAKATDMVDTPANLVTTIATCELCVVGPQLDLPNANKCFYRVVAVDSRGLRSGPSDVAGAPRPFIYTRPLTRVAVGQEYSYEPRSLGSIGDLRCKRGYKAAFWNRDEHTFELTQAPDWMSIDAKTGRVAGRPGPQAAGTQRAVLRVADDKDGAVEQAFRIDIVADR